MPARLSPPRSPARRSLLASALVALCATFGGRAGPAAAATPRTLPPPIEGIALDVHDGDSFTFRGEDGRRLRIRVSGIDAPEHHQPYAEQSRRHLGEMLRGRRLRIDPIKQDVFDRTVAKVWVLDADLPPADAALSLVEAGLAWHFVRYRADQPPADVPRYAQAERAARARRAGLWQDAEPEAPWDFRARMRRNEATPPRRPRTDPEG
ncbi:MAG: thermonuclease family protein [Burkholderiales bacterium]|nr:thermonuclease family protein [Burkholderiales bacterium]